MHPIEKSFPFGRSLRRLRSFERNSGYVAAPFAGPYTSHAIRVGNREKYEKYAKPPITFSGDFRRKKNGAPDGSALKEVSEPGRQKLTSSTGGRTPRRNV